MQVIVNQSAQELSGVKQSGSSGSFGLVAPLNMALGLLCRVKVKATFGHDDLLAWVMVKRSLGHVDSPRRSDHS